MFELIFLGTSASAPSIHRGLSSTAVITDEERYLVDCGEGTQRQILRSGMGFKRLNRILLTHPHLDHILGVGGLVSTFSRWETMDSLEIWGSSQTLERVESLIYDVVLRHQKTAMPIYLKEVKAGKLFENKQLSVTAFPVTHRGKGCFGYIFEEHTRRPFLVEKAEALNIPIGPERGQLVRGQDITLVDGRVITPDMVLGDEIKGLKVVFTGDTARTDNLLQSAQNADVMVIEATFLNEDKTMARSYGHITAKEACELAQNANVRDVLLTHLSRRYRERDIIREAKDTYPHSYVVRDLDHFIVRRDDHILKVDASIQKIMNEKIIDEAE